MNVFVLQIFFLFHLRLLRFLFSFFAPFVSLPFLLRVFSTLTCSDAFVHFPVALSSSIRELSIDPFGNSKTDKMPGSFLFRPTSRCYMQA